MVAGDVTAARRVARRGRAAPVSAPGRRPVMATTALLTARTLEARLATAETVGGTAAEALRTRRTAWPARVEAARGGSDAAAASRGGDPPLPDPSLSE